MKRILISMVIMGSLLTACTIRPIGWRDHDSDRGEHRDRDRYDRDHHDRDRYDRDRDDDQRRGY